MQGKFIMAAWAISAILLGLAGCGERDVEARNNGTATSAAQSAGPVTPPQPTTPDRPDAPQTIFVNGKLYINVTNGEQQFTIDSKGGNIKITVQGGRVKATATNMDYAGDYVYESDQEYGVEQVEGIYDDEDEVIETPVAKRKKGSGCGQKRKNAPPTKTLKDVKLMKPGSYPDGMELVRRGQERATENPEARNEAKTEMAPANE